MMPSQWFNWGEAGTKLGRALMGGKAAYQQGFDDTMTNLGRQALMAAQMRSADAMARKYDEEVLASQQRRKFQTPEFATTLGTEIAGLTQPQAKALDGYIARGDWGMSEPREDHVQQMTLAPQPLPPPDWATPETIQRYRAGRAAHLANLGGTGNSNAEQIAKFITTLSGTNLAQERALRGGYSPEQMQALNAFNAADKGAAYQQSANGVLSQITGQEVLNEVGQSAALENRGQAENALASADKNRAWAAQIRHEMNAQKTGATTGATTGEATAAVPRGKPPENYQWVEDGSRVEPIPGGPADIKARELSEKRKKREEVLTYMANSVLDEVKKAKKLTGPTTAGAGGLLKSLPITEARKLDGHIQTIRANLGFDRLQLMRDLATQTGGALGQVAVQELFALQNSVTALDQLQKHSDLYAALTKIERHYKKWLELMFKANAQEEAGAGMSEDERRASVLAARQAVAEKRDKAEIIRRLEAAGIFDHGID